MQPGEFNKRVSIFSKTPTADADGFKKTKLETVLTCWAKVQTTSGMMLLKNDTDFTKALTRFTIYYTSKKIERGMFVLFKNSEYLVEYVNNIDEANEFLEIQARKVEK